MSNIKTVGVYPIAGTLGIEVGHYVHGTGQIRWRFCESALNPAPWRKAKVYYTKNNAAYFITPIGRVRLDKVLKI